tara:strand:+ start:2824 stop:3261 length:438 start_codon:yes stop_codon:yes gene_type:complete
MKNNNSVYTVTPPDLKLPTIGPSVLLLGITLADYKPYADVYDKLFPEVEITFFVGDDAFTAEYAAWYRAVASMASSIFVNLDNITPEEVFLAMQAEHDKSAMIFWISQEKTYPPMVSLLNSYQYRIFNNLAEIEQYLLDEYGSST